MEKLSLSVSRSLAALAQESTDWMDWISACPPLRTGMITSYWRMLSAVSENHIDRLGVAVEGVEPLEGGTRRLQEVRTVARVFIGFRFPASLT